MNGIMSAFERVTLDLKPREFIARCMNEHGATREEAKQELRYLQQREAWRNDQYLVITDKEAPNGFPDTIVWHLSIKRHDKQPVHDWRDMQAIKNLLCGAEAEAIELYPAESRLIDQANQYHLFVFMRMGDRVTPRIPVGWQRRAVMARSQGSAVQREIA